MYSVSVVINTYNRAKTLRDTLQSLQQLDYPNFEVIVVNGPSTDDTEQVLSSYHGRIKSLECKVRNLSTSRNIGIQASSGDIIAFLDDDACADSRWLSALVEAYEDPTVGVVGGWVYDHTGYSYQCKFNLVDRLGVGTSVDALDDVEQYTQPGSFLVLSTIGTNTSFRATMLRDVGGFDEAHMAMLDETDVCVRMIDAGYQVRIVPEALIYHRYAASFQRTHRKVPTYLYHACYCRGYYTYRNGLPATSVTKVLDALCEFEESVNSANRWFVSHNMMDEPTRLRLITEVRQGLSDGIKLALTQPRQVLPDSEFATADDFVPFLTQTNTNRLRIALASDGYPPENYGGVARWTKTLADQLVQLGHEVHVLTIGGEHPTVNFENGVWVHRLVGTNTPKNPVRLPTEMPPRLASYAYAVYDEVMRCTQEAPFDIVAWHIWENIGLACLTNPEIRSVLFIESAYGLIRPFKPAWQPDTHFGREHVQKMVNAEQYAFLNAPLVIAPSQLIVDEYHHLWSTQRTRPTSVISLGTPNPGDSETALPRSKDGSVRVLYVGRLENRKGIDLLLAAIPSLCNRHANVRFVICGEDITESDDGVSHRTRFERTHANARFWSQVTFTGKVSDEELQEIYASCDIFVAPSRFESFGLIFVEAMAYGKPVVALAAGGATEIVRNGADGFLVPPDDVAALEQAISKLVADHAMREAFSRNARMRYLDRFTDRGMAEETIREFRDLIARQTLYARPRLNAVKAA
jgi:glycogen synthase